MGNPHPSKSKPVKIGRKHHDHPSRKIKDQRAAGAKNQQQKESADFRRYKNSMADFWNGKRPLPPPKP